MKNKFLSYFPQENGFHLSLDTLYIVSVKKKKKKKKKKKNGFQYLKWKAYRYTQKHLLQTYHDRHIFLCQWRKKTDSWKSVLKDKLSLYGHHIFQNP